MTLSAESQKTIDVYLAALRKQLRELMDEDANDIVEEIRTHILDKTSGDAATDTVSSTLAALGTPEELASRYRTDDLLKRAQSGRSFVLTVRSLLRWATLSFAGLVVFLVSLVGYCLGGGLVMLVAFKLIWPRNTGLWKDSGPGDHWMLSFSFSSGEPPHHGQELLGWWLLPICLILGSVLLFLTFRFGTWSIRKFWRPRAWRRA